MRNRRGRCPVGRCSLGESGSRHRSKSRLSRTRFDLTQHHRRRVSFCISCRRHSHPRPTLTTVQTSRSLGNPYGSQSGPASASGSEPRTETLLVVLTEHCDILSTEGPHGPSRSAARSPGRTRKPGRPLARGARRGSALRRLASAGDDDGPHVAARAPRSPRHVMWPKELPARSRPPALSVSAQELDPAKRRGTATAWNIATGPSRSPRGVQARPAQKEQSPLAAPRPSGWRSTSRQAR